MPTIPNDPSTTPAVSRSVRDHLRRLQVGLRGYGIAMVLVGLCIVYSLLTIDQQQPTGRDAALDGYRRAVAGKTSELLFVAAAGDDENQFVAKAAEFKDETSVQQIVQGTPQEVRKRIELRRDQGVRQLTLIVSPSASNWTFFDNIRNVFPEIDFVILQPRPYRWPNFIKRDNLLNIANQIAVIAIIAVGMTLVIIAGGIDLSVGSLIALSAVIATRLVRDQCGGLEASGVSLVACSLAAIAVCALIGAVCGSLVAYLDIPPFIVTLSFMLIASGMAYTLSRGESIDALPKGFEWLGSGTLMGIPNTIWLLAGLYAVAHIMMRHMVYGRCVYAVGGNREAARLSGLSVPRILISTYVVCGALAGLGGIIMASKLKSGAATYGDTYELYVIAAVVVGGTSLRGGEGNVLGTLVGAFTIAVIQNGMNLTGIESYTQKIVFGVVILLAVLIDQRSGKA